MAVDQKPDLVVHVAAEGLPFSKVGGLADVVGGLSAAQSHRGLSVAVILPFHLPPLGNSSLVEPAGEVEGCGVRFRVLRAKVGGVQYMLLDSPRLFHRPNPYGTPDGEYLDNPLRFAAFSEAAAKLSLRLVEGSGRAVVHCHDWQTALVPALFKVWGRNVPPVVFTVHNPAYQGRYGRWVLDACGLPDVLWTPSFLEFYGELNFLKGGVLTSDLVTTVSPTFAAELLRGEGFGLGDIFRYRAEGGCFVGVLNGIDTGIWNPTLDPWLPRSFGVDDVAGGKTAARRKLLRSLGMRSGGPVFFMVSRLVEQKGVDLVLDVAEAVLSSGRLVVLGQGDLELEERLRRLVENTPDKVAFLNKHDEKTAHLLYAAGDFLLMPSRFEPCGTSQMIAMAYGAIPIVTATGGLADTVEPLTDDFSSGTGFVVETPSSELLAYAVDKAVLLWRKKSRFQDVRKRVMAVDNSWIARAEAYDNLYSRLIQRVG